MRLTIKSNISAVKREMSRLERRELPKAIRNALNDTAFDVRQFTVGPLWRRSFPQARNRRFPGVAFRVIRASNRRLVAEVYDRLDRFFLPEHITGRDRTARAHRITVPIGVKRTATGRIPKNKAPNNLKNAFVADLGKGPGVWQRQRDGSLKLMYVLEDRVNIDKRFPFFRLGAAKARQRFPGHMQKEARFAIKRAEKRANRARLV